MASVNKVILIGNLGRDPEMRYTPGNVAVCNFTLATNDKWKDKAGQMQERTEWHRIVVWGRQAEIAKEYLAKGRQVYIEGSLQTREWNDKEGNKRTTTEIRTDRLQFIGGRDGAAGGGGANRADDAGGTTSGGGSGSGSGGEAADPGYSDDDIPF